MNNVWREKWKSRKFRRHCIAAGAGIFLLLAAVLYASVSRSLSQRETYLYKEETVGRGDLYTGVMESGSVQAAETEIRYELNLEAEEEEEAAEDDNEEEEGEISYLELETVCVVPGQYVKEGEPLFTFTTESMEKVRSRLKSAVSEKEAAVLEAEGSLQEELLTARSEQDRAVLLAARADSSYQAQMTQEEENINGMSARILVLTQEAESSREKLCSADFIKSRQEARLAYEQAEKKWKETDTHNTAAYTANYSAYLSAKEACDAWEQQAAALEETMKENALVIEELKKKIEDGKAGLAEKELEAAKDRDGAVTDGELANQIYDYTARALQETADSAQKELTEAENTLSAFEAFVGEDGIITAPENGRVLAVSYEAGDKLEQQGAMLTLAGETAYSVTVDVSEEDIAEISVGDSVRVELSAYEGEVWEGTVSAVTTTRTSEHANTVSYPVTVSLSGDPQRLFDGMTAEITFVEASATDVLYVSQKAIVEETDGNYVYVKDPSGARKLQKVTCGFSNGTAVEIISGLEEGQTVYIRSRGKAQEAETE